MHCNGFGREPTEERENSSHVIVEYIVDISF